MSTPKSAAIILSLTVVGALILIPLGQKDIERRRFGYIQNRKKEIEWIFREEKKPTSDGKQESTNKPPTPGNSS